MPENRDNPQLHERHLWDFAAVRDAAYVLGALVFFVVLFSFRAWLAPLAVGFALAYVFDPLHRGLRDRFALPRVATTATLVVLFLAGLVTSVVWLLPLLLEQLLTLIERVPAYLESFGAKHAPELIERLRDGALLPTTLPSGPESAAILRGILSALGRFFGLLGDALSASAFALGATLLFVASFCGLSLRFDRLPQLRELLPAPQRDAIWEVVREVDAAFSAYIRGQLIVAAFTTTGFCVGFWLTDVPYWFVVALIGGALSLIPYGQMSGWILAIVLKYLETQAGDVVFSWLDVCVYPSIVYLVTQSMESWVITPLVQGEAAQLHPLTIIIVLVIGGGVLGIVGLVLAIPVTATIRTLAMRYWLPRWREYVKRTESG